MEVGLRCEVVALLRIVSMASEMPFLSGDPLCSVLVEVGVLLLQRASFSGGEYFCSFASGA